MNNILNDFNKNGFVKIENVFDKPFIDNVMGEIENLTDVDTYERLQRYLAKSRKSIQ